MSTGDPVIERRFDQAANRWKWLRFIQHAATFGASASLALLIVGALKVVGWSSATTVVVMLMIAFILTPLVLMGLALLIGVQRAERARIARAWEDVHAPLLDRLNTLVYLEKEKETPVTESFAKRIKAQARTVLKRGALPIPFPAARPLIHGAVFAALLLSTLVFYSHYKPYRFPPIALTIPSQAPPEPPLVMPPPENVVEQEKPWGEVRITKPGADLAVTPAEDIPLQIEAAANRPLKSVAWVSAVNGGDDQMHDLPSPSEPLFAAYQPVLSPRDLKLSEWDVVTYHAKATAQDGTTYKSETYFVEVRPFREEILKSTGGDDTELYEILNELTGLIEQQQEVIRRSHRAEETIDGRPSLAEPERTALAQVEDDLAKAAEHLAARLAAATDHPAVKDPIDRLEEARSSMKDAASKLRKDEVPDSRKRQREALAKLVAARKKFQKAVAENPDAFPKPKQDKLVKKPAPDSMLKKIAEFRDERRVAEEFVKQTLEQQRKLNRQPPDPKLAKQQEALGKALEEFRKQHPEAFKGAEKPCAGACQSLGQAAQSLQKKAANAPQSMTQAAAKLDALHKALQEQGRKTQLADAYDLKKKLDDEIEQFGQIEKKPDDLTPEQLQEAVDQTKETVRQLKEIAEKAPTRDEFDKPLREALSKPNQDALEKECAGLCKGGGQGDGKKASGGKEKGQAAGAVKKSLEKMARAFDASRPQGLAGLKGSKPLDPKGREALDRGLDQLERLTEKGQAEHGRLAAGESQRQRAEAVANLEAGLFSSRGHNDRTVALVDRLKRDLLGKTEPVEAKLIDSLRDDLLERPVEVKAEGDKKPDEPKATHLDPTRLPPAYRKAIETYFEKLSERK